MKYIIAIHDAANDVLSQHVVESVEKLNICQAFSMSSEFENFKKGFDADDDHDFDLAIKNNDLNVLKDFDITLNYIEI